MGDSIVIKTFRERVLIYTNAIQNCVYHVLEGSMQEAASQCLKLLDIKLWPTNEQAVKDVKVFINPFEGLLQLNHVDASQLAREWDCSKVSGWKASHSSLGQKFGRDSEKLQRQIPKYLSYDLYSAVISSFNGNSGEERMKSGYRNKMLEKGLEYLMPISAEGPASGLCNCRPAVDLSLLTLTRTSKWTFWQKTLRKPQFWRRTIFFQ